MRPNPKYFIRLQHNVLTVLIRPAHYAADVQGLAAALSMTGRANFSMIVGYNTSDLAEAIRYRLPMKITLPPRPFFSTA